MNGNGASVLRGKRDAGVKADVQDVARTRAKRPGGGKTRLDDDAVRRRCTQLAGRRGR